MSDASGGMRRGEKRRAYGTASSAPSAPGRPAPNITIAPNSAPTCTVFDALGAVVGTPDQAVTGSDQPTPSSVRVWLLVDTTSMTPGDYTVRFKFTVLDANGGTTLLEPSYDFELLDEPHLPKAAQIARTRLVQSQATLPDTQLYPELDLLVRRLQLRYPMLGSVVALTGDDRGLAEEAIGLMTAIRMRAFLGRTNATGDLVSVKLVQQQFTFAGGPRQVKPLEQIWLEEAYVALGQVASIKAYFTARAAAFNPFQLSGPTRTAKATGLHETLMSGLVRLLTDDWNADTDSQSGVGV
jgi:hypothetical protein